MCVRERDREREKETCGGGGGERGRHTQYQTAIQNFSLDISLICSMAFYSGDKDKERKREENGRRGKGVYKQ